MSEKIRIRHVHRDIDILRNEDIFVCHLVVPREDPKKLKALEEILSNPWVEVSNNE